MEERTPEENAKIREMWDGIFKRIDEEKNASGSELQDWHCGRCGRCRECDFKNCKNKKYL